MNILKWEIQGKETTSWNKLIPGALHTLNIGALRVYGFTPAELLFGFIPRGEAQGTLEELFTLDGLERTAYGLRLTSLDEPRGTTREKTTIAADAILQATTGKWTPLEEGNLVLLRRFEAEKHHGMKLETQWEGPHRLVDMSYPGKSGRLQDIQTGEIVRVKKGRLKERVYVNDLKLLCPRHGEGVAVESDMVELANWVGDGDMGRQEFNLAGG